MCVQDFLERLPLTCMTDPRLGSSPLNLASALQPSDNPTDLGPKSYIAYGRRQESTTGVGASEGRVGSCTMAGHCGVLR